MARNRNRSQTWTRLTGPLVLENGVLRPATWDEVLDRAAAGFQRNLVAHGPDVARTSSVRATAVTALVVAGGGLVVAGLLTALG